MATYNPAFVSAFERRTHPGASLLSYSLGFLIPLVVGVYWLIYAVDNDLAIAILRPAVLGAAIVLGLVWSRLALTWAEMCLAGILGMICLVLLIPSLTATIPARALTDCVKLALLCALSLLVCRALRHEATARAFGQSLILGGIVGAGLIIYTYARLVGFAMPTYESVRVFKGVAIRADIPLNSVAFASVFSYICGMCLLRGNRLLWLLGIVLFPVASVLTGSRAPIALLLASGLSLLFVNGIVSRLLLARVLTWTVIVGVAAVTIPASRSLTFKDMSIATEGRWDLWWIALQKFEERPLTGYGFDSWNDDIVSRLPGEYVIPSTVATNFAGGYHSEYLALLAEQGLIGFIPVMTLFAFLLRCSWLLALGRPAIFRNGQWALFGCLFLLLRAGIEAPGLFGYGSEPADYLAFFFLAIVVSRFSVEEDYLRGSRP